MNSTCVICHGPNPAGDRTCSRDCDTELAYQLGHIHDYPDDIEENTEMTTYLITYTYSGDIVEEVDAASVQEALEQAESPGHKYTTEIGGIEIDLYQYARPRVTLKRPS